MKHTYTLHLDLETYSTRDLKKVGVYNYVEDPEFMVLMMTWSLDGGPVQICFSAEDISAVPGLTDPNTVKVAHNAQFDRVALSSHLGMKAGTYLDPAYWRDTMAIAAILGLPQSLERLAKYLKLSEKDSAGTRLINWFCKPNPKTGERRLPEDHPEKWAQFCDYAIQDTVVLQQIDNRLGARWPLESERQAWTTDQIINDRGIRVDKRMALAAARTAVANERGHVARIVELSGNKVVNPNSLPQLNAWLTEQGVSLPNLRSETVSAALAGTVPPAVREVLELRQELALTTSKKYGAALSAMSSDQRLRGMFRYFGAHTGRWSGRRVQLQNLARASLPTDAHTEAAILDLVCGFGGDSETLKKLVRAMFVGPFVVSDYSAIEARVIAWLAGEEWVLEAFRQGRDIYVETAKAMSTPGHQLTRYDGKVAVLALGYNGGAGSLFAMGYEGSESEAWNLVKLWRKTNPRIVRFWADLEVAFCKGEGTVGRIRVESKGSTRKLVLPSGRAIYYRQVSVKPGSNGRRDITFFDDTYGRSSTYGGRLAENVTQAVARDMLSEALSRLEQEGLPVVGHIHDEVLVEAGEERLEDVNRILCDLPDWAEGFPIRAEGFATNRYKKG